MREGRSRQLRRWRERGREERAKDTERGEWAQSREGRK